MDSIQTIVLAWIQAIAALLAVFVPIFISRKEKNNSQPANSSKNNVQISNGQAHNIIVQQNNLEQTVHQTKVNHTTNINHNYYPKHPKKDSDEELSLGMILCLVFFVICTAVYIHRFLFTVQIISYVFAGIILVLIFRYPTDVLCFR